jgi:CheY-like chemotaxis protein
MAIILCIDDEPSASRKLLLESAGHQVIDSQTGAEGIQVFRSNAIDLAILDYFMSGMNGLDVARALRAINPAIPIIMLSGFGELPGEAPWINRWIVKGHSSKHLLNAVEELTRRS